MKTELGTSVRDTITGFQGMAIAYTIDIAGSEQFLVQPPSIHEGQPTKPRWMDVSRLEVLGAAAAREQGPQSGAFDDEGKFTAQDASQSR